MPLTETKPTTTYNGWTNYETWNVALWINNDEGFYATAELCTDVSEFIDSMFALGCTHTPDGVAWDSSDVDFTQLNDILFEEMN
jgi:hypothetical protein